MLLVEHSQTGAVPACPLREGSCFELKHKHRAKTHVHIKCIEQTVKNMHFWNRLFMWRTLLMHTIIVLFCNITIFPLFSLLWVYIWHAQRLIMSTSGSILHSLLNRNTTSYKLKQHKCMYSHDSMGLCGIVFISTFSRAFSQLSVQSVGAPNIVCNWCESNQI